MFLLAHVTQPLWSARILSFDPEKKRIARHQREFPPRPARLRLEFNNPNLEINSRDYQTTTQNIMPIASHRNSFFLSKNSEEVFSLSSFVFLFKFSFLYYAVAWLAVFVGGAGGNSLKAGKLADARPRLSLTTRLPYSHCDNKTKIFTSRLCHSHWLRHFFISLDNFFARISCCSGDHENVSANERDGTVECFN